MYTKTKKKRGYCFFNTLMCNIYQHPGQFCICLMLEQFNKITRSKKHFLLKILNITKIKYL